MISRSKSGQSRATRCRTCAAHRTDSAKPATDCGGARPYFTLLSTDIERVHVAQGCASGPHLTSVNAPARRSMTAWLVQVHGQDHPRREDASSPVQQRTARPAPPRSQALGLSSPIAALPTPSPAAGQLQQRPSGLYASHQPSAAHRKGPRGAGLIWCRK